MPIIAMTQEMATLGKDVALGLCEALRLKQVRHEIGDVVAGRLHVKKSLIRRIREGKASAIEKWSADEKTISIFTAEEVYDLAVSGDVLIRGWGATQLLRQVAHVPCIRVCAPLELRIERLMQRLDTDDAELARREILSDDAARAARIAEHFGVIWGDPVLYDLTLNTERLPVADCVDMVVNLMRGKAFQETPQSRQCLANLALRARVRAALRASPATVGIDVSIEADAGKIIVSGIVINDRERELCVEGILGTAGVREVENRLKTMTGGMRQFPSGHHPIE